MGRSALHHEQIVTIAVTSSEAVLLRRSGRALRDYRHNVLELSGYDRCRKREKTIPE